MFLKYALKDARSFEGAGLTSIVSMRVENLFILILVRLWWVVVDCDVRKGHFKELVQSSLFNSECQSEYLNQFFGKHIHLRD